MKTYDEIVDLFGGNYEIVDSIGERLGIDYDQPEARREERISESFECDRGSYWERGCWVSSRTIWCIALDVFNLNNDEG